MIDATDAPWACGASQLLTKILEPTLDPSCTVIDFELGSVGWTTGGTCAAGALVAGAPELMVSSDIVTQVCGDHTTGTGSAFFSAPNSGAGAINVDGGECIATSPTYPLTQEPAASTWHSHGQRDASDDSSGDYFELEMSTDGGASWGALASYGDERVNAVWAKATALVAAGSDLVIRVGASDGASAGDLVEAGVDDLAICPIAPTCSAPAGCNDRSFCAGVESCVNGQRSSSGDPCAVGKACNEAEDRCNQCTTDAECNERRILLQWS